jgi:hypothetical protein
MNGGLELLEKGLVNVHIILLQQFGGILHHLSSRLFQIRLSYL